MNDRINFEEDWDAQEFDDDQEYNFLKSLHNLINKKSYPKKNTRKFLRLALDMVKAGEITQKDLDGYIDKENINKDIVREVKAKYKKRKSSSSSSSGDGDPCGHSSSYSSC